MDGIAKEPIGANVAKWTSRIELAQAAVSSSGIAGTVSGQIVVVIAEASLALTTQFQWVTEVSGSTRLASIASVAFFALARQDETDFGDGTSGGKAGKET